MNAPCPIPPTILDHLDVCRYQSIWIYFVVWGFKIYNVHGLHPLLLYVRQSKTKYLHLWLYLGSDKNGYNMSLYKTINCSGPKSYVYILL